jgi:hypothetical protein
MCVELNFPAENLVLPDTSLKFCNVIQQVNCLTIFFLFSLALQPSAVYGLLFTRGLLITHNDAPHSVGLLWTSDQLVAETSTCQHTQQTNIHAPGGIRTHDRSRRVVVDLRFRPRGHCDR